MGRVARKIMLFARQAGSAHAFLPLLDELRCTRPGFVPTVFADGAALSVFRSAGVAARPLPGDTTELDSLEDVAFVLTGTDIEPESHRVLWEWARSRGLPSAAFVDNWVNYWQRFVASPTGPPRLDFQPDRIVVIDDLMRRRLVEAGAKPDRIVVAGDPRHALLARSRERPRSELRADLGFSPEQAVVLFIGEPLSAVYDDAKEHFGYDEIEVFEAVCRVLERAREAVPRPVTLVVRRHPAEPERKYREEAVATDADRHELARASDVVVGMTSSLLYEASLIGCDVISFRPGSRRSSDLIDSRPSITTVEDEAALLQHLIRRLESGAESDVAAPEWLDEAPRKFARVLLKAVGMTATTHS